MSSSTASSDYLSLRSHVCSSSVVRLHRRSRVSPPRRSSRPPITACADAPTANSCHASQGPLPTSCTNTPTPHAGTSSTLSATPWAFPSPAWPCTTSSPSTAWTARETLSPYPSPVTLPLSSHPCHRRHRRQLPHHRPALPQRRLSPPSPNPGPAPLPLSSHTCRPRHQRQPPQHRLTRPGTNRSWHSRPPHRQRSNRCPRPIFFCPHQLRRSLPAVARRPGVARLCRGLLRG
jgi:hypothetical protein